MSVPGRRVAERDELRKFSPYPAYKESEVDWLETVPAGWEVAPLFTVAHEHYERNDDGFEQNVLSLSYGRIIRRDISGNFGLMPESFETYQIVEAGNLVLRLTDLQNDKRSLRVGLVEERGIVTSAYVALDVARNLAPRYAFYLLHAYDVMKVFYSLGGGVRQTMRFEDLKWMPLLIPSPEEQRGIASFLDRETAKTDALIAKKEHLIELLQEKRTALITRAVTRGLDPNVPMKDSGVEWLGEIPAHWKVKSLKLLASLRAGSAITAESIEESGEFPVYGGNGIRGFTSSYTHEGDFPLIGRQGALCGCVNFASGRFWASEHAVVAAPAAEVHPHWLAYLLQAMSLNSYSESAAQPGLAVDTISALRVPAPTFSEQRAITGLLDQETSKIDSLITKVREGIDRLKEYRTALISAAVTGKIDVREETTSR